MTDSRALAFALALVLVAAAHAQDIPLSLPPLPPGAPPPPAPPTASTTAVASVPPAPVSTASTPPAPVSTAATVPATVPLSPVLPPPIGKGKIDPALPTGLTPGLPPPPVVPGSVPPFAAPPVAVPPVPNPAVPPVDSGVAGIPAGTPDDKAFEMLVERVRQMQKDILVRMNRYRASGDVSQQTGLMMEVRSIAQGLNQLRSSSEYTSLYSRLVNQEQASFTRDYRWLRVFGPGGKLATIQRADQAINAFLGETPQGAGGTGVAGTTGAAGAVGAAGGSTAPGASGTATPQQGATGATGNGATNPAAVNAGKTPPGLPVIAGGVRNSYGITPAVFTDSEIRALLDPMIDEELARENAKLSSQGLTMNRYRQLIGNTGKTSIKSVGRPSYDHYLEWLKAAGDLREKCNQKARERAGQTSGNPASVSGPGQ